MIRTLILHDVCLIGDLLTKALADESDIEIVGRAETVNEAMALLKKRECDVVLVNILLPDGGAARFTKAVAKMDGDAKVVVTGLIESKTAIMQCLEMGAAGYVHQDDSVNDLITKIRCVHKGEALVSPQVAGALIARVAELKRLATELNGYREISLQDQCTELTAREREILGLIGKGYTNQQIADALVIGVGTVKNHVHNILEKLDVHTRKQAAMIARQLTMGEPTDKAGAQYTWPQSMGITVKSRREAAAVL